MDKTFNMDTQVSQIYMEAWFHLRNISKLNSYLDKSSTEKLVSTKHSNNGLLYGVSKDKTDKLQCVQNAAAGLDTLTKYEHITRVLKSLHWLPIE